MKDEILEEVWRAKDALAAKYNYSVAAMFADLREREKTSGRRYVDLSKPTKRAAKPKRPAATKH
jgi:hypothetical protein